MQHYHNLATGAVTTVIIPARKMYCLECRKDFIKCDPDHVQPAEEGVFLKCNEHEGA